MHQKVILQFRSVKDLWAFKKEANPVFVVLDAHVKLIICECTDENITLAKEKYKAEIINFENKKAQSLVNKDFGLGTEEQT